MPGSRIVLTTIGSLGDLHPYVALAIGLQRRGHQPVVASSELYREKVEREGIEFAPIRPNLEDLGDEQELMAKIMHPLRGSSFVIKEVVLKHIRNTYEDLYRVVQGCDLIVGHALTYAAPIVAEQQKIPFIGTALQPMIFMSTSEVPVLGPIPWLMTRPWGPRFYGPLMRFMKKSVRSWARPLDRLRREKGLGPYTNHPLFDAIFSQETNLVLFSKFFAEPQPDWPPNCIQVGFPFYDSGFQAEHSRLSSKLEEFLNAGAPPVVFTLGSSAVVAAGSFYHESFKACVRSGIRSVLLVGRDDRNRPTEEVPPHVCIDDYAPYSLLLPRAAAVVHQGGVGTTAQSLRAGKPQLIVPFSHDQPDNAHRVVKLGCGFTLSRKRYSASTAIPLLEKMQQPVMQATAAQIGKLIASENGVEAACDAMEQVLAQKN